MNIDQVALMPAYAAAGTAVAAFLADLAVPGRRAVVAVTTGAGAVLTGLAAIAVGHGPERRTFCATLTAPLDPRGAAVPTAPLGPRGAGFDCSYVAGHRAALLAALFAGLTLAVVALSWTGTRAGPAAQRPSAPSQRPGEYYFLLACAMTGGVVLGYAGDLVTLVVALETLTLPLYILVGLRRGTVDAAVTFFVVSVVSTAVALLGAGLLYASTGALHFGRLAAALAAGPRAPLTTAGIVLLLAGLSFKVAAVPFHAWAPPAYDGAPVPVAAYLSTASKLGGVIAILYVAILALRPAYDVVAPTIAVLAVLSMTVGNLVALRQDRMVRLLAWSSVAQAGYLLAPLGAGAPTGESVAATLGYTVFYLLLELGAFGAVIGLRGGEDGGRLADYAGAARRSPWIAGALGLSLIGLAGLPPGLAGLFAKIVVVRALLSTGTGWLAVIVALNAVLGLAYYLRAVAALFRPDSPDSPATPARPSWSVMVALGGTVLAGLVVGVAPQLVLSAAHLQP